MFKSLMKRNFPSYVIFFVTARCNAKCSFCFNWKNIERWKEKKELSLIEIEKIAKNFGNLPYLTLSGGEPFLRKDIVEICRIFKEKANTKFITIPTNGIDSNKIKKDVEEILKLNVHLNIRISLDDLNGRHDKMRNVKGCFEKALKTYKLLKELKKGYKNFNLDVMTVFSKMNEDRIKEIFEYFKKMDLDHHYLGLIRVDSKQKELANVSIEKYEEMLKWIKKNYSSKENRPFKSIFLALDELNEDLTIKTFKEGYNLRCYAGKKLIVINEEGEIYPCELLSKSFGNLRDYDYDIKQLLKNGKAKGIIRFIKKSKCHCTWGCSNFINIMYNVKMYPKLLWKSIR
ncbi:MAG: radical SAM protein [Nanoarchaeota archaeon]|nr:radical SAM protein [Nanoarchaeota archaeon]